MSNQVKTQEGPAATAAAVPDKKQGRKLSSEVGILLILIGIAALFEILGWVFKGDTFLFNPQRLFIIVLQVSVVGLLAIAVTQVIITGGIDLSSGSVLAVSAMVAASLAQTPENTRAVYPALTNLPFIIPLLGGVCVGMLAGVDNGTLIARYGNSAFHRDLWYDGGRPWNRSCLYGRATDQYVVAEVHLDWFWLHARSDLPRDRAHIPHCTTLYALRQFTYAIGAIRRRRASRVLTLDACRLSFTRLRGCSLRARWCRHGGARRDRPGRYGPGL